MTSRSSAFLNRPQSLLALIAFALALRIVFLVLAGANAPLTGDELAYQQLAENFAAGKGLFQTNNPFFPGQVLYAWQAPLYPLLLGMLYQTVGASIPPARFLGVLVSTATVYVMFLLTRRVARAEFGGDGNDGRAERIAFAAAFLVAIYPGFLTNAHLLLSETLFILLLLLALLFSAVAVEENRSRAVAWGAGAGALWGLATLTRGITFYFTPFLALWIAWAVLRRRNDRGTVARALGLGLLFVAATALVIAPWTARNYQQFGQVVLLETKGGVNLWLGNSPYTPDAFIRDVWKVGIREPMLAALPEGELQRDRAAYGLALDYIRAEPLTFVARLPVKFADFWGFERNLIDVAEATARGGGWNSPAKIGSDVLAIVVYMFVMVCGTAGFVFAPNGRYKLLLGGFSLYFLLAHLAIFGDGRFHLPLIPFFALYGGWMLVMFRKTAYAPVRLGVTAVCVLILAAVWARELWTALAVLGAN